MQDIIKKVHYDRTVVILDWDDTLLPSSWITQNGHRLDEPIYIDEATQIELQELEEAVIRFLQVVSKHGTVIIITNAETGWVELSASKFFPKIASILHQFKVISARSTYECIFPDSPLDWKYAAFSLEIANVFDDQTELERSNRNGHYRNILSLGDSYHERQALYLVTSSMHNVHSKSVKFMEKPTINSLRIQMEVVQDWFSSICLMEDNVDVMITEEMINEIKNKRSNDCSMGNGIVKEGNVSMNEAEEKVVEDDLRTMGTATATATIHIEGVALDKCSKKTEVMCALASDDLEDL